MILAPGDKRRGVSRLLVMVLLIALVAVGAYSLAASLTAPEASIIIGTKTPSCSQVNVQVRNDASRILRIWTLQASVSPTDSAITVTPAFVQVQPLAPKGVSGNFTFQVSFNGAPRGVYQLNLSLMNGTKSLGPRTSVDCQN